jgi:hypothetical protein
MPPTSNLLQTLATPVAIPSPSPPGMRRDIASSVGPPLE